MSIDVAVIGLGAMGSAALYHLARRGAAVIGIDRYAPPHDHGSSHGESRIIRLAYFEHPSYVPLLRRAYENWRALECLSGEDLLTITGIVEAGPPGSALVAGSLEACRLHGIDHTEMDGAEISARFPAFDLPRDYRGVFQKNGGYLKPERAIAAHLRLAEAAGAETLTTAVRAITPRAGHIAVDLGDRVIEAGRVIVAAGPWIADLVPELRPHLRLTQQTLCWYRPRDPTPFAPGRLPVFIVESEDDAVYGFPDFAGSGFKCASHRVGPDIAHASDPRHAPTSNDEAPTHRFLERFMPDAPGSLNAMKTCIYTRTPDEDFILDTHPRDPRIVVASPCSGHGFKFASVIGEILADLATAGSTRHDIARLGLARFGIT
ncbi:MAG: N-methyl-L-tryptophan oxidase [Micropepsaceae bacterium]